MSPYRKALQTFILFTVVMLQTACHRRDNNQPPVAVLKASQPSPAQPTTFAFSSTGSSDGDGTITAFKWEFGDGTTSTDASPTHVFGASGSYSIRLTITDDEGATASATNTVNITTPAVSVAVAGAPATVTLPRLAVIEVAAATFPAAAHVGVWATSDPVTAEDFNVTSTMFGTVLRASSEIRVNTGKVKPTKSLTVTANVPAELAGRLQERDEPQVFVQIFQDGGEEVLDSFELVPAAYDAAKNTLRFELEPDMLTDARTADDSWEAVFVIGSTRTKPSGSTAARSTLVSIGSPAQPETLRPWPPSATPVHGVLPAISDVFTLAAASPGPGCGGSTLKPPLNDLTVTGAFSPPKHKGVDFRASNGSEVRSMADGTVSHVGFDERPLKKPDARSGKMVKGWGHYIMVTHSDGSQALYAHLQAGDIKVAVGAKVNAATLIALSDNSGGSQAPHLHVEYAPNGGIFKSGVKADPHACIGSNVAGTVEVSDNGTAADDAFSVSVNGRPICSTEIGAANTCSIGALRTGTATLLITAIIAPDNVGTYMISLGNGIKFENGSATVSGSLTQGGSASFIITVP